MLYQNFYRAYRRMMGELYPSTQQIDQTFEIERLISPYTLDLDAQLLQLAEKAIAAFWSVSRRPAYRESISCPYPWLKEIQASQASVLMAYDFHSTVDGKLRLIEINTNAAAFLLSDLAYKSHGLNPPAMDVSMPLTALASSFQEEAAAAVNRPIKSAAIVDQNVIEQKMYIEFLMYKDWMGELGWPTQILDSSGLDPKALAIDFIYNRTTDFYLTEAGHDKLCEQYRRGDVCLSPHPREYWLLADKERLAEMAQPNWLESVGATDQEVSAIREVLIPTYDLAHFGEASDLWAERKNLIFKPRRSHGGKAVYRGASVSRKVFDRILEEDYLAQEFVPAPGWPLSYDQAHMENWKFDLRFFVYRDKIQLVVARSYQGQITNFSSLYGGLTAIRFN